MLRYDDQHPYHNYWGFNISRSLVPTSEKRLGDSLSSSSWRIFKAKKNPKNSPETTFGPKSTSNPIAWLGGSNGPKASVVHWIWKVFIENLILIFCVFPKKFQLLQSSFKLTILQLRTKFDTHNVLKSNIYRSSRIHNFAHKNAAKPNEPTLKCKSNLNLAY